MVYLVFSFREGIFVVQIFVINECWHCTLVVVVVAEVELLCEEVQEIGGVKRKRR